MDMNDVTIFIKQFYILYTLNFVPIKYIFNKIKTYKYTNDNKTTNRREFLPTASQNVFRMQRLKYFYFFLIEKSRDFGFGQYTLYILINK